MQHMTNSNKKFKNILPLELQLFQMYVKKCGSPKVERSNPDSKCNCVITVPDPRMHR